MWIGRWKGCVIVKWNFGWYMLYNRIYQKGTSSEWWLTKTNQLRSRGLQTERKSNPKSESYQSLKAIIMTEFPSRIWKNSINFISNIKNTNTENKYVPTDIYHRNKPLFQALLQLLWQLIIFPLLTSLLLGAYNNKM